jgi:cob(I)alamin adenosyltransferase
MKLYTKRGDDGQTDLFGGPRVSKDDLRVRAYGDIDETNAAIGLAIACCRDDRTKDILGQIQSDLFSLGAELATPQGRTAQVVVPDDRTTELEHWIDQVADETPPLRQFILPGGCETAARLQLARTVARRAERSLVALAQQETVRRTAMVYVNRLSDLLFALARLANHRAGVGDVPWQAPEPKHHAE